MTSARNATISTIQALGFNIVIYPVGTIFTAARAMQNMLTKLRENRQTTEDIAVMTTFEEYNNIVGMKELVAMESGYKVDEYKKTL